MFDLISIDSFEIKNRGTVFVVESPIDYKKHNIFMGKQKINGKEYTVIGVEDFLLTETSKGTKIGLLVENIDKEI